MKNILLLIPLSPQITIFSLLTPEHHSPSHMGGAPSFFLFFFLHAIILLAVAEAVGDSTRQTPPSPSTFTLDDPGNSPPSPPVAGGKGSPFKPSVVVIVGVLATLFSLTFLLLLYVKHCKPEDESSRNSNRGPISVGRKNSGIDRTVIESLPIFRFGSLRGQKDGLECAVCLNPFEPVEILRLLPKCKHAFHVECVDTWLDAHSTCPLCRYRVDPEDILLVEDVKVWPLNQPIPPLLECSGKQEQESDIESGVGPDPQTNSILRRVSGRHSSVGERGRGGSGSGGLLQIILQQRRSNAEGETTSAQKKTAMAIRRSVDGAMWSTKRKRNEVGKEREGSSGCDGPRKDGLLLAEKENKHRLEHRIIVSPSQKPKPLNLHQRWSDVQPSDLLYLTSEMLLRDDSRRLSSSSCGPSLSQQQRNMQMPLHRSTVQAQAEENPNRREENRRGRMMSNLRSVSEITGLSRRGEGEGQHHREEEEEEEEERQAGVVSRWKAWISQGQGGVR